MARRIRPVGLQTHQGYQLPHGLAYFAVHHHVVELRNRGQLLTRARQAAARAVRPSRCRAPPAGGPARPSSAGRRNTNRALGQVRLHLPRALQIDLQQRLPALARARPAAAPRGVPYRCLPCTIAHSSRSPRAIIASNSCLGDEPVVHTVLLPRPGRSGRRRHRDEQLRVLDGESSNDGPLAHRGRAGDDGEPRLPPGALLARTCLARTCWPEPLLSRTLLSRTCE